MAKEGDGESTWVLNVDVKDAVEGVNKLGEKFSSIGETEGLGALSEKFIHLGTTLGLVAAAVLAIKESMDLVFDAENINAVNHQFEKLSENAGLAAEALKGQLMEASNGLLTENQVLGAANKALVTMGANAKDLAEIMTVARQASNTFGGDILSNFEALNQAISTGSTRQLRHLGIIIDQTKAYREYAIRIGATVDSLSQAGKQAAVMQAVLEKSKSVFGDQVENIKPAQTAWQQLKTALSEIGEAFTVVFSKVAGPIVIRAIGLMGDLAHGTKSMMMAWFGDESQKAQSTIESLNRAIDKQKESIVEMKAKIDSGKLSESWVTAFNRDILTGQKRIEDWEAKIESVRKKAKLPTAVVEDAGKGSSKVEDEKALADETKFQADLLKLRQARFKAEQAIMTTEEQASAQNKNSREQIEKEYSVHVSEIYKELNEGKLTGVVQANQKILELSKTLNAQLKAQEEELFKFRKSAADNYLKQSTNVFDAIGKVAHKEAVSASNDTQNFVAVAKAGMDSTKKNFGSAFMALGEGSQNAGDAMKGFILSSLADIAQAQAEVFLLQGIENPPLLAAAAGLFALSGVLRGAAGSSASSSGLSGGGGTATPSASQSVNNSLGVGPVTQQQQAQKSVNINIAGNYLETPETQAMITTLVRQSSDATDFKISSVGGGI